MRIILLKKEFENSNKNKENSNIIIIFLSKLLSDLGSYTYGFVLGLYILKETGSSLSYASIIIFALIPKIIFGPISGVIVDKLDRKLLIISSDILSGLTLTFFYLSFLYNGTTLLQINILGFILSMLNTFFDTAVNASIPNLVNNKKLNNVNSSIQSIGSLTQIIAPILGGLLFAWFDLYLFLLLNAFSFFISAIFLTMLNFNKKSFVANYISLPIMLKDLVEGFSYIKKQERIFLLFIFAVVINFLIALGIQVPVPYITNEVLKLSPQQYGIISSAFPIGILVGSILISLTPEVKKKFRLFCIALCFNALIFFTSGFLGMNFLSRDLAFHFYIIIYFLFGIIVIYVNVPVTNLLMSSTEDNYRGRVFGTLSSFSSIISPLGILLSGILILKLPAYILCYFATIGQIFLLVIFAKNNHMKKI